MQWQAEVASDFPQGCGLHSIPSQLRSASRLQHMRIGADGTVLRIEPADLETLSAMRSLTWLSVAQVTAITVIATTEDAMMRGSMDAHHLGA